MPRGRVRRWAAWVKIVLGVGGLASCSESANDLFDPVVPFGGSRAGSGGAAL